MELEIVNRLYLELSQITTATTAKEIELHRMKTLYGKLLREVYNNSLGDPLPGELVVRIGNALMGIKEAPQSDPPGQAG